ncbi:PO1 beta superfamily nucleotidyltransferase [Cryptosporidium ubiquitum]|uniref:PO1 beta superfamily nucleotidyltransferase n=1 Tax=Cryptosporidium ubiquitum TaxID=857276 RepID=A0A1J4MFN8_9CRYT|nr:PO1 beta superfamily nucleotidyltransferase [Cryptosporidium ubiquitum]OII71844.1 PO1 beta superfamily nucleotidyltransferase [Cryptosporidium ubiquitum]
MTITGKRNAETGQRRRSVLVSVDRVLDPTSEKKDASGKSGRRSAHSNKRINPNLVKNTQTDNNKGGLGGTEISSSQSSNKLGLSSLNSNNAQNRKKKPEKSNGGEGRCTSQSINAASSLPSPSVPCSPISASAVTSTPKSTSIPSSDCLGVSKVSSNRNIKGRTSIINENITSPMNIASNSLSEPSSQHNRSGFSQGIVHNNAIPESQQCGQIHVPLIAPIPHQFWYNQLIPQDNIGHIVPPPPDYFPDSKTSSTIQKQDLLLSGGISSAYPQFNLSSIGKIGNSLMGATPSIFNGQIPYFQPYSLRSYEISTLNVINYLIPNKEFILKVSSVVNDLRNWLEQSKIPLLVFPYGSTSTGFADQFSDVDIALIPKQDLSDRVKYGDSPISGIFTKPPGLILQELLNLLQNNSLDVLDAISKNKSSKSCECVNSLKCNEDNIKMKNSTSLSQSEKMQKLRNPFTCIQDITSAHIPIIRMLHTHTDIVLDISIALPSNNNQDKVEKDDQTSSSLHKILPIQKANSLPIIQSRLGILTWYARMDPRVVHVVVLTKVWTRFRGLRNTLNGFPGGYAWTICVIYFFQKIGILPVIDANEFFIKSHNASKALFKNILEDLNTESVQSKDKINERNPAFSSIRDNYKEGGKDIYLQSGIEKTEGIPEESYVDGSFPSLVSDLDQEETVGYKDDIEEVSNGNYDTETASGSVGIAEQAISSDSSFDSEPDKGSIEKDSAGSKMLYLDVVKGSKFQYKTDLEGVGARHGARSSANNNRYSISEDSHFEGSLLNVRNLNLDKPLEEHETFGESSRSSIGSTACTYSPSTGILSSDNICNNCTDPRYSCVCSQPNTVNISNIEYSLEGICCRNGMKQIETSINKDGSFSSTDIKDCCINSNREIIKKEKNEFNSNSVKNIFDIDELFSNPPTLISNVKTFEESKFLKFSQSHTLFYRFLKFIETHLWTTVIDISSPEIVNTTIPGICCDIRNPFPGPPACRPIFDENNKKHLRNEIQRAIQIIQSPFGDFSSICGGYLNISNDYSRGRSGGSAGVGSSILGQGLGLPLSPSNVNTVKQKISSHQHFGAFEAPPLHIVGYNQGGACDQNNGNILFPSQVPVANLYSDSPQHFIFPSISVPLHIPPPPPPPPPKINKQSSSVLGVARRNSFESIKHAN